jgi:cytochrome oxidase Cu insertion factor (SCO1/SenC/PrrC family)
MATMLLVGGGLMIWTFFTRRVPADHAGAVQVVDPDAAVEEALPQLTEFELLDQTGKRFSSHDVDGQVWAGSFFFSTCPSTCYQQNIKLQQLYAKYAAQGFKLVSITCDPNNDTPTVLARYASRFNADAELWKFLAPARPDMQYLRRIGNDFFGVAVGPATHTDRVVLRDRQGQIVGAYSVLNVKQYRELDQQIERLLAAQPAEAAVGQPES